MSRRGGGAGGARQQSGSVAVMPRRVEQIAVHLSEHVDYPASKREIITACSNLACFSYGDDREWLEECLENRSFRDSDEVEDALQMI